MGEFREYDVPLAGGCCLIVFITSIVLFACSFDVLEPRYYGLVYDDTFKTVSRDEIRREARDDSGRFLIGLGRSILSYSQSLIVLEWLPSGKDGSSMSVWTSNGQSVFLDLSLQIRLVRGMLPQLYYAWGLQWRDWLRVIIEKKVKEVSVRFHTLQFFEKRVQISNELRNDVGTMFASEGDGFFTMVDFQLRKISLPSAFDEAVIAKLLKKQRRQKARNRQQVSIRQAQKNLVTALADADAALVLEMARQEGTIKVAKERTDGESALIRRYATLYKEFADGMGWLNTTSHGYDALHFYIYSRLARDHRANSSQELIGF
ncbi:unnamed protein product [Amoebophrya sp. A120]|nr:unnamed protein product [Amoebophrya sp. A120]|eukprot:GSA120T00020785001.1